MKIGKTMEELVIGEEGSFSKTITEVDIAVFAAITGDFNPMHMNESYARTTRFGKKIAHGGVAAGLVSPILGMQMPGVGTVPLEFKYKFLAPVYPGDTITCLGRLTEKDVKQNTVTVHFTFSNQEDKLVMECWAKAMPPRRAS